jgi:hydroxymethylbilane synthase
MIPSKLTVATRKSQLALTQTRAFVRTLILRFPGLEVEELHVTTTGDRIQDKSLADIGGKGLFIKEIEEALLEGQADFAVHSMKDLPADLAPGLSIACVPERQDARDAFISPRAPCLADLPLGSRVGTSSLRLGVQLGMTRSDLEIVPLRGNVDTRLRRAEEGHVDAVILACAGLLRLGWADRITERLAPEQCLPAVAQGALAIECRQHDSSVQELLQQLNHPETAVAVAAERGVMRTTGGNCHIPLAAYARRDDTGLWLRGLLADPSGKRVQTAEVKVPWPDEEASAARIGEQLGLELKAVLDCPHANA